MTKMLTMGYCVGSATRERLTNFDNTLCLLKQLFALKMGYCKAPTLLRLSKVNMVCLTSSAGLGLGEIVV